MAALTVVGVASILLALKSCSMYGDQPEPPKKREVIPVSVQ
jgi:hypothetical protein